MVNKVENRDIKKNGSKKTAHYFHENITWKRLLYFYIQENSFLKTRLSEVVDSETDQQFISQAEYFQNEFILKEECMHEMEYDISLQEKSLQLAITKKEEPENKVNKQQDKLRNEMAYLEKGVSSLRDQFNKYLLSII